MRGRGTGRNALLPVQLAHGERATHMEHGCHNGRGETRRSGERRCRNDFKGRMFCKRGAAAGRCPRGDVSLRDVACIRRGLASSNAEISMRYLLGILGMTLFSLACGPAEDGAAKESVRVAPGETCGEFSAVWDLPYYAADCADDGWCMPETVTDNGNNHGICIDVTTDCSQGGTECPDDWGCVTRTAFNVCLRFCESHSDCRSPAQVCDFMTPGHGLCRVRPCLEPPREECPTGTSCSDEHGLCVAD